MIWWKTFFWLGISKWFKIGSKQYSIHGNIYLIKHCKCFAGCVSSRIKNCCINSFLSYFMTILAKFPHWSYLIGQSPTKTCFRQVLSTRICFVEGIFLLLLLELQELSFLRSLHSSQPLSLAPFSWNLNLIGTGPGRKFFSLTYFLYISINICFYFLKFPLWTRVGYQILSFLQCCLPVALVIWGNSKFAICYCVELSSLMAFSQTTTSMLQCASTLTSTISILWYALLLSYFLQSSGCHHQ